MPEEVQKRLRPLAVWHTGRRDDHRQPQPEGVHEDVTLTTLDLLTRVIAADPPVAVVFTDGLAMRPALGWRCLPAATQVMQAWPRAVLPPAPEGLVDDLPWRHVRWQQTPRTTAPEDRHDGIADVALRICLGASLRLGPGDHVVNQGPLAVTEIGRVWFAGFHLLMITGDVRLTQPF